MTTDTLESTETAQVTSDEAAPDDRVEGLLASETATAAEETGQEANDPDPSVDVGPSADQPDARLKWLDEQYKAGHLTDEQVAERGSLRQSRDAIRENLRKQSEARTQRVEKRNSLIPDAVTRIIGTDDNSRDYIERRSAATTLVQDLVQAAEDVATAEIDVEWRSELRSDLKSLGYSEADVDEVVDALKSFKDVANARVIVRERVGQNKNPEIQALTKKLADLEKENGELRKAVGDGVSARSKGGAPSSAGRESAGGGWSTKAEARKLHVTGQISNTEMRRINADPTIPEGL